MCKNRTKPVFRSFHINVMYARLRVDPTRIGHWTVETVNFAPEITYTEGYDAQTDQDRHTAGRRKNRI